MKELIRGHSYMLDNLKDPGKTALEFYMDPDFHNGDHLKGPSTQEVLRACIARVKALDQEKPAPENKDIIHHLRQAIIGHEVRALRVALEQGDYDVEWLTTNENGHVFTIGGML